MNKIRLLSYLFIFCFSVSSSAQELDWLKNSTSNDVFTSHSFYSSTQYNNDFYFAGDFWKDLNIDNFSIEIGGDSGNGFIIKMDETGTASALYHLKSDGYVRINSIAVNPVSGSLIATGNYDVNLMFDNQVWTTTFLVDGFVMSINPDGTLDWIKIFEPQSNVSSGRGDGLAIDEEGNIFVGIEAGGEVHIDNQSFLFEPETGGIIIAKISPDGDLLMTDTWKSLTFEGWTDIVEMDIDNDNELVIGGSSTGTVEIGDSNYVFSQVAHELIIVKYSNDLNLQWLKTFDSSTGHIRDVYTDGNELILSIQYRDYIDLDGEILTGSGSYGDMAIASLNENAELNWAKNFTLSENGGVWGVYGSSITEWNNQYYIGGLYQGDIVHEGALILDNSQSGNTYQYPFILSLSKEGEFTSAYDFVGSNGPGMISSICASESHLLFGGDFSGQITFGDSSVNTINSALFYGALAIDISGLEVMEDDNNLFAVYPTLSSDYLNIKTKAEVKTISLISSSGIFLKEFSGDTRLIDVNNLTAGLYYLSADIDGEMIFVKFIKQ